MYNVVVVGANRGDPDSTARRWIHGMDPNNVRLFLIEPHPLAKEMLEENYKDYKEKYIYPIAISSKWGTLELHTDNFNAVSQHGSINYNHLISCGHSPEKITTINVQCYPLDSILIEIKQEFDIDQIDLLVIDTEGHDAEIILASDLSKYNIKTLIWETAHADGHFTKGIKYNQARAHLKSNNFQLTLPDGMDEIWETKKN